MESMLSRGKLVQDWRQRLSAAEAQADEQHRLRWLYRMRVRLYRFLLSCYRDGDWRADEASPGMADEMHPDAEHGSTTTLIDVPLNGKPAKTIGKMQAVLKSLSAAQDHPPEAGPLTKGIADDEWVIAVSPRDKLQMHACQELLETAGVETAWGEQGALQVRHFDLAWAVDIIRHYRPALRKKMRRRIPQAAMVTTHRTPSRPIRLAILLFVFAPIFAFCAVLSAQMYCELIDLPLLHKDGVAAWMAIAYIAALVLGSKIALVHDYQRKRQERNQSRRLVEEEAIADNRREDES